MLLDEAQKDLKDAAAVDDSNEHAIKQLQNEITSFTNDIAWHETQLKQLDVPGISPYIPVVGIIAGIVKTFHRSAIVNKLNNIRAQRTSKEEELPRLQQGNEELKKTVFEAAKAKAQKVISLIRNAATME
ncbi:hypothetical protein HDV00_008257 [Rhizophlyctis rosea]|nr:hypothetical protein HDV00_008257 [Rhizophlyctis rosea]